MFAPEVIPLEGKHCVPRLEMEYTDDLVWQTDVAFVLGEARGANEVFQLLEQNYHVLNYSVSMRKFLKITVHW